MLTASNRSARQVIRSLLSAKRDVTHTGLLHRVRNTIGCSIQASHNVRLASSHNENETTGEPTTNEKPEAYWQELEDAITEEALQAAQRGDMRQVNAIINRINAKYNIASAPEATWDSEEEAIMYGDPNSLIENGGTIPTVKMSTLSDDAEVMSPPIARLVGSDTARRLPEQMPSPAELSGKYDATFDQVFRAVEAEYDRGQMTRTVDADGPEFPEQRADAPSRRWSYLSLTRDLVEEKHVSKNPYMSNVVYDTEYFTMESDPLKHTDEHVGKYFLIATDEEKAKKRFPEGYPGELEREFELATKPALMIREQGRRLVEQLEQFKNADANTVEQRARELVSKMNSNPIDGFKDPSNSDLPFRLLMGPRGIGKSAIMAYAIQYARQHDWITVSVPSCFKLTQHANMTIPSTSRPGFLDQPDFAYEMVCRMHELHSEQLHNVPQRRKYARDRYLPQSEDEEVVETKQQMVRQEHAERAKRKAQVESKGEMWDPATMFTSQIPEYLNAEKVDRSHATLGHLVEWGMKHPPHATDCFVDLMEELKLTTEFPVLIAIDQINWLYEPVHYAIDQKPIEVSQMSLAHSLRVLNETGYDAHHIYKRGFVLAADSYTHSFFARMYESTRYPRKTHIPVDPLDRSEIHYQLLHYHYSRNFWELRNRTDVDSHAVDYYRTMSDGNPREVQRAAMAVLA